VKNAAGEVTTAAVAQLNAGICQKSTGDAAVSGIDGGNAVFTDVPVGKCATVQGVKNSK